LDGVFRFRRPEHSFPGLHRKGSPGGVVFGKGRGIRGVFSGAASPLPGKISVLVVDDNRFNRSLTRAILRKMGGPGWMVSLAEGGAEALHLMEERHFDLVFMDVQMPEMDGLECARLARKLEAGLGRRSVIIAMTAYAMEGDRRMCLDGGMDDYIAKPVEAGELRSVISRNLV